MSNDLDILQRDGYIEMLKNIIDGASEEKKSTVFAIDGKWGVGKSFIIDKLNNEIDKSKYVVFNYNCWQYDYYEEPLVAIISNIQDNIEKCYKYYNYEYRKECRVKKFCDATFTIGNNLVKKLTNIDLEEIGKNALDLNKTYDKNSNFNNTIKKLQGQLHNITDVIPIIFIIDELDRCMPEYAIKVLERLHHIFHGFENVIILLSVDRTQLECSIKKIFGENTDIDGYLKKFVDFTIKIDGGSLSENWIEKYDNTYLCNNKFKNIEVIKDNIKPYLSLINIREQEKVINKAETMFKLLDLENSSLNRECMCIFGLSYVVLKDYLTINNNIEWMGILLEKGNINYTTLQLIKKLDKKQFYNYKFEENLANFINWIVNKRISVFEILDNSIIGIRNKNDALPFGLLYSIITSNIPDNDPGCVTYGRVVNKFNYLKYYSFAQNMIKTYELIR